MAQKRKIRIPLDPSKIKRHDSDTGSPEYQIRLLSKQIATLQEHLQEHPKDVDAKRALLKKVAKRKRFLKYLKKTNLERYMFIIKQLKLKEV